MPVNTAPTAIFPGVTISTTAVTIPLTDLGISQSDAGDHRKLLQAITEKYTTVLAATATADRPTHLTVARGTGSNQGTNVYRQPYTINIDLQLTPGTMPLAAEGT